MIKKIEDLQLNGYKIFQSEDCFRFGVDSVLLSNFVIENYKNKFIKNVKKNIITRGFDLCTGTGIIPILLHAKFQNLLKCYYGNSQENTEIEIENNKSRISIDAIEINDTVAQMAEDSLELNKSFNCNKDITIINDNLKNIFLNREKYAKLYQSYDFVTVNPPYIKLSSGLENNSKEQLVARAEAECTFDDVCHSASCLLQTKASFYMIHKVFRLAELITILKKYNIEPKNITFLQSKIDKSPELFLLEGIKDGGEELHISPPQIINWTQEKKWIKV